MVLVASKGECSAVFSTGMTDTTRFTARGFGPGLPPEGRQVDVTLSTALTPEAWPEAGGRIKLDSLQVTRQGHGQVVIAWDAAVGRCALIADLDANPGGEMSQILARLPTAIRPRADGATRRWLLTLLLLCLGLPLLASVALFTFRSQLLDWAVARISVEHEIRLSDELWSLQKSRLTLIESTSANRVVDEIGGRLAAAAPSPYRYRFFVAADPAVNAYALPAGVIVVNRGLIEKTSSAEELAGVLAHEISHVEQRHGLRGMVQSLGLTVAWTLITGDLGTGLAGEGLRQLAGLHFSRQQEVAADEGGFARLRQAGISASGMVSFFATLQKEEGDSDGRGDGLPQALALLSTHPASGERSQRLAQLLQTVPAVAPLPYDWALLRLSVEPRLPK